RRVCQAAAARRPAQAGKAPRAGRLPRRPSTMAKCLLRGSRAIRASHGLVIGETVSMKKPPTGEPYAGKPPVRFGGRGRRKPIPTPISSSLTFPAVHQRSSNVSSHSHERNSADERVREPKPHDLGLQISCRLHPEMLAKDVVSGAASASGRSVPQACASEGIEGRRRAFDARSCAHAAFDPAEIRGVAGGGFIKGKSAIHMARVYGERKRNFVGQHFWARGFFVNTVGRDEDAIRAYIRNQEKEDQRLEQLNLWR